MRVAAQFAERQPGAAFEVLDYRLCLALAQAQLPQVQGTVTDDIVQAFDRQFANVLTLIAQVFDEYLHLR